MKNVWRYQPIKLKITVGADQESRDVGLSVAKAYPKDDQARIEGRGLIVETGTVRRDVVKFLVTCTQ